MPELSCFGRAGTKKGTGNSRKVLKKRTDKRMLAMLGTQSKALKRKALVILGNTGLK